MKNLFFMVVLIIGIACDNSLKIPEDQTPDPSDDPVTLFSTDFSSGFDVALQGNAGIDNTIGNPAPGYSVISASGNIGPHYNLIESGSLVPTGIDITIDIQSRLTTSSALIGLVKFSDGDTLATASITSTEVSYSIGNQAAVQPINFDTNYHTFRVTVDTTGVTSWYRDDTVQQTGTITPVNSLQFVINNGTDVVLDNIEVIQP